MQVCTNGQQNASGSWLSSDGTALPASVRDAAMKALQSSESVRRRLISAAEDTSSMIAKKKDSKRHRSDRTSEHRAAHTNGTATSGCSSTLNQQWVPGALHHSTNEDPAVPQNCQATAVLNSMPSDVPRRPTLGPKRRWDEPRPATAPVFGEDTPDPLGLYGNQAVPNRRRNGTQVGGGMDQHTACLAGSLHRHDSCRRERELHSHALDSLGVPGVPCTLNSDQRLDVATGGVTTMATGVSPSAEAAGSSPPTRSSVRRSVSVTEKWLTPSDRRRSGGGSGIALSLSLLLLLLQLMN